MQLTAVLMLGYGRQGDSACMSETRRAAIDRYHLSAGPTAANPPHTAAAGDRSEMTMGHAGHGSRVN